MTEAQGEQLLNLLAFGVGIQIWRCFRNLVNQRTILLLCVSLLPSVASAEWVDVTDRLFPIYGRYETRSDASTWIPCEDGVAFRIKDDSCLMRIQTEGGAYISSYQHPAGQWFEFTGSGQGIRVYNMSSGCVADYKFEMWQEPGECEYWAHQNRPSGPYYVDLVNDTYDFTGVYDAGTYRLTVVSDDPGATIVSGVDVNGVFVSEWDQTVEFEFGGGQMTVSCTELSGLTRRIENIELEACGAMASDGEDPLPDGVSQGGCSCSHNYPVLNPNCGCIETRRYTGSSNTGFYAHYEVIDSWDPARVGVPITVRPGTTTVWVSDGSGGFESRIAGLGDPVVYYGFKGCDPLDQCYTCNNQSSCCAGGDADGDGFLDREDPDDDNDGILDDCDTSPTACSAATSYDPCHSLGDFDGDGTINSCDSDWIPGDTDNDGIPNDCDADSPCNNNNGGPCDPNGDADGDGYINSCDSDGDVDGDTIPDELDATPYGPGCGEVPACGSAGDADGDDIRNDAETDADGDGIDNECDVKPYGDMCGATPVKCSFSGDFNGDGVRNDCDDSGDVDGDGVPDDDDPSPFGCGEGTGCECGPCEDSGDADDDGTLNEEDDDDDGDGVDDDEDVCPRGCECCSEDDRVDDWTCADCDQKYEMLRHSTFYFEKFIQHDEDGRCEPRDDEGEAMEWDEVDWESEPWSDVAECDWDEDGCINSEDPHPCDDEVSCGDCRFNLEKWGDKLKELIGEKFDVVDEIEPEVHCDLCVDFTNPLNGGTLSYCLLPPGGSMWRPYVDDLISLTDKIATLFTCLMVFRWVMTDIREVV